MHTKEGLYIYNKTNNTLMCVGNALYIHHEANTKKKNASSICPKYEPISRNDSAVENGINLYCNIWECPHAEFVS